MRSKLENESKYTYLNSDVRVFNEWCPVNTIDVIV